MVINTQSKSKRRLGLLKNGRTLSVNSPADLVALFPALPFNHLLLPLRRRIQRVRSMNSSITPLRRILLSSDCAGKGE